MTANDNGSRQPCQEPEARPVTDTTIIIHKTTDMCQQAVLRLLVERYGEVGMEGYDATLVGLAGEIDYALALYDATQPGPEREARTIDIASRIEALADAPPPAPLDHLNPYDIEWVVEVEVQPTRIIASVLERLPATEATLLRTYLGGAGDLARARLDAAIRTVAEGVVSREVTRLWLPSRAAAERGAEVEDLGARVASDRMALAMAAAVAAVEHASDWDWVSTLAMIVERTALEVEGANPAWGASLDSDARLMATVAAYMYCAILEAGIDYAIIIEEQLAEQVEAERRWDPDQVAAEATQAVVGVIKARGVRVTEAMELATMTSGQIMRLIGVAREEIELERRRPELDRGYRRDAAKQAKAERKKVRKAQREGRRRGRAT